MESDLIIKTFGKLLTKEAAEALNKSAEQLREAEEEYKQVVNASLIYRQCAYGL